MTELDIVNDILRAVGSSPVNSISSPHPYVRDIRVAISREVRNLQRRGYWFNTEYNVEVQPTNGKIVLSNDIVSIVPADSNIILRGRTLFHRIRNSNIFDSNQVITSWVRVLPLEDTPESMQDLIRATAAKKYVSDTIGDMTLIERFEREEQQAMILVLNEDLEAEQLNAFDRPTAIKMRYGVRPYRHYRSIP